MKLFQTIVTLIIISITAICLKNTTSFMAQFIVVLGNGLVSAFIASIIPLIDTHGYGFKMWYQSKIKHRNKDIYLSFSYLYKIEVEGRFLLIRGHRMKDRFQPIGGVYKFYQEAKPFLESIKFQSDTMIGNTDETDDLRIRIKGKYLLDFIDWFIKMENREYGPEREFYEEMIASNLLPEEQFRHLRYRKIKVHNKGITKAPIPNRIDEVIYADIFEVTLTEIQKQIVKKSVNEHPKDLCLASPEEMKSRCFGGSVEMNLGNNVPWLLEEE